MLPFGTFSWLLFCRRHDRFWLLASMPDWTEAFVTGALAHGLTNLALDLWIVTTKQWGFW